MSTQLHVSLYTKVLVPLVAGSFWLEHLKKHFSNLETTQQLIGALTVVYVSLGVVTRFAALVAKAYTAIDNFRNRKKPN